MLSIQPDDLNDTRCSGATKTNEKQRKTKKNIEKHGKTKKNKEKQRKTKKNTEKQRKTKKNKEKQQKNKQRKTKQVRLRNTSPQILFGTSWMHLLFLLRVLSQAAC